MKIAINETLINKPSETEEDQKILRRSAFTFENHDLTQAEFARSINKGYAFCPQHKDKHRKSSNFTIAGFLAVDIDNGMTLEEAMANEFVQRYAAILYKTFNHAPAHHRFRIVFELARDISDGVEMRIASNGIIKKFGGDPSCKDACRMFYGSKNSNPHIFGNIMPNEVLDEILLLGREATQQYEYVGEDRSKARAVTRSSKKLPEDIQVISGGNLRYLRDLEPSTPVHCPVHEDQKASAVTVRSERGSSGVYCSACGVTYWMAGKAPGYNFDYGLRCLQTLTDLKSEDIESLDGDEITDMESGVIQITEPFLPDMTPSEPIIFVKSPKGTGKTEWLKNIVARCKKANLSVLLIGHRQSLIISCASRLKLEPYIHLMQSAGSDGLSEVILYNTPTRYFAICADSLSTRLSPLNHKFDVVLIDEVEQVLSHLTSDTLKERRIDTVYYLQYYLNTAKQVYVLDADLNRLTIEVLENFISDNKKAVRFMVNDWKADGREIELFASKQHLQGDLIEALLRGERCFVCSNSKKGVERLEKYLRNRFGDKKKIKAITSGNSSTSDVQNFIRNINRVILDYDVVLTSPTMGTGVDINFPGNVCKIDAVYGIFESRVNTHFDIDQQISRVRNPGKTKVWVSPERFNFETDAAVIEREILETSSAARVPLGIGPDGIMKYHQNDLYLNLYANVLSLQRGSKNSLRENFVKLKEHNGWTVRVIGPDRSLSGLGSEAIKIGNKLQEQVRIEQILKAKLITRDEYETLRRKRDITHLIQEETDAMRRYEIESFYYEPVSETLIKEDGDGKLRGCVRRYELYMMPDDELAASYRSDEERDVHWVDRSHALLFKTVLRELFQAAGVADNTQPILIDTVIAGDSLGKFANCCLKHKRTIERIFKVPVRGDIKKKPAQQLSKFLSLIGIRWKSVGTVKKAGAKIYRYQIPAPALKRIEDIAARRRDRQMMEQWHHQREITTEHHLFNENHSLKFPRTFTGTFMGHFARGVVWEPKS